MAHLLTHRELLALKPQAKPYRTVAAPGLYLEVHPNGRRSWVRRYRLDGRESCVTLGTFPEVSLAEAFAAAKEVKATLREGEKPRSRVREDRARRQADEAARADAEREAEVAAGRTFEVVAWQWFAGAEPSWKPGHARTVRQRLDRWVLPFVGAKPAAEVTAGDVKGLLAQIEATGAVETARRVRQIVREVFRYAQELELRPDNPAERVKPPRKPKPRHLASLTRPADVGRLLRAIRAYRGGLVVSSALRLAPLVFVRPGELRQAEWSEVDFDRALWTIPGSKMKMGVDHVVPLSRQALEVLRALWPFTGSGRYVFPSPRGASLPLSNNGVRTALLTMGYDSETMTGHGFRAMARTLLDEQLRVRVEWIEHQLAHAVRDANGRAYNRTTFLDERREMMQLWADYLDRLAAESGAALVAAG